MIKHAKAKLLFSGQHIDIYIRVRITIINKNYLYVKTSKSLPSSGINDVVMLDMLLATLRPSFNASM